MKATSFGWSATTRSSKASELTGLESVLPAERTQISGKFAIRMGPTIGYSADGLS